MSDDITPQEPCEVGGVSKIPTLVIEKQSQGCELWSRTYIPNNLLVVQSCQTVSCLVIVMVSIAHEGLDS